MSRFISMLSIAALLSAAAQAQCFSPATGTSVGAGVVAWDNLDFYLSTYDRQDEGVTNPPIAFTAFPSFPMAGVAANLDRMFIATNGEIYLFDSTSGATQPAGGSTFGTTSLAELRGGVGGMPRLVPLGLDMDQSTVLGAVWDITVDQSVPGECRVTWTDMARYASTTDRFSFDCTLFSSGAVRFSYGSTIPAVFPLVGLSIGNDVGSTLSPSRDLTAAVDSGTEGMLYELFGTFDLAGKQILLQPNGLGGYFSTVTCGPAFHQQYGTGCYSFTSTTDSFHEFFAQPSLASAALQGNAMNLSPTPNGYVATWIPGGSALYVAPTGGATNVFTTASDDGTIAVTPSVPMAVPGGSVTQLNVAANGIISFGATGANTTDFSPTSAEFATATVPAVYTWHDWRESEVPSGRIKREEVGGVLYLTWDGVESYADPDTTQNPGTIQFQLTLATGNINVVWVAISPDDTETTFATGKPYVVGYGGSSTVAPAPITLSTGLPVTTSPNVTLQPLSLSASPAPIYTIGGPSVPITWTASNIVDLAPPFGIGISLLLFSVAPLNPGVDLAFLGMAGCNLNIASIDVSLTMPGTAPTSSLTLAIPQPLSPGLSFYAQVLSLFPPNSLPNGQNPFGGLLSNGLQSSFNLF